MFMNTATCFVSAVCRGAGLLLVVLAAAGTAFASEPKGVPEIDPSAATSALTLLVGGALLLTDRLCRAPKE